MNKKVWGLLGFCLLILMGGNGAHAHDRQGIRYFVQDGQVEFEGIGPGTTPQTPFAIASVGKLITAVAVLQLVEQGALGLDQPIQRYLPASLMTQSSQWDGVTVRHLLMMTSGLPDYLDDAYIGDALDNPAQIQNAQVAIEYISGERRLFQPGRRFDYSNTNYVLLGLILETVTGRSYANVIDRQVLRPARMRNSFVFGSRALPSSFPAGHEDGQHYRDYYSYSGFGDGGVIASAQDLAKFYSALFLDKTLLSANMLQTLLNDPRGNEYGMGVEIEGSIVGHSGGDLGFASDIRLDLSSGAIALILHADAGRDTDWPYDRLQ